MSRHITAAERRRFKMEVEAYTALAELFKHGHATRNKFEIAGIEVPRFAREICGIFDDETTPTAETAPPSPKPGAST